MLAAVSSIGCWPMLMKPARAVQILEQENHGGNQLSHCVNWQPGTLYFQTDA